MIYSFIREITVGRWHIGRQERQSCLAEPLQTRLLLNIGREHTLPEEERGLCLLIYFKSILNVSLHFFSARYLSFPKQHVQQKAIMQAPVCFHWKMQIFITKCWFLLLPNLFHVWQILVCPSPCDQRWWLGRVAGWAHMKSHRSPSHAWLRKPPWLWLLFVLRLTSSISGT